MAPKPQTQHWKKQFILLKEYAEARNWHVRTSKFLSHEADEGKRLITIQQTTPESMVYYLMHEIGHSILFSSDAYTTSLCNFAQARERKAYGTMQYRTGKVEEEIAAWNTGKQIAEFLGVEINEKNYNKLKAKCLASYMVWAVKRQTRNQNDNTNDN